ncbi:MAG: T9SS type A sorting domain-containing protein [Bacteroidetes bacterium]|nr:T9SS type A sorting domain-containing protein [Bacteroidota bacterium]
MIRTTLTLLFLVLLVISTSAQITITSSHMPDKDDTIRYSTVSALDSIDYEATDTNYLWDFSYLESTGQGLYEYKGVGSINPAYLLFFGFSAYGLKIADTLGAGSYSFQDVYDIYKNSSSKFEAIGRGLEYNGLPIPSFFDDDDEIYQFPLDYGDVDSSTYAVVFQLATLLEYHQIGIRVNEVEGWGTIKTPYKTYDCIKIKTTLVGYDSIVLNGFPLFNIPRTQIQYKWLSTAERIPVFEVSGNSVFGNFVASDVRYRDVWPIPLNASFYADPLTAFPFDTISLYDTTAGNITERQWDINPKASPPVFQFINGSDTSKHAQLVFTSAATFSVSLKVMNPKDTSILVKTGYLTIVEDPNLISEIPTPEGFIIYPNPVNTALTIELEPITGKQARLSVYNILGNKVYSSFITANEHVLPLSVNELRAGVYLLVLEDGQRREVRKFVVQ